MDKEKNLFVSKMADLCEVHPNTVKNYEKRGLIRSTRDINNFRRYSVEDALTLKKLLKIRKKGVVDNGN